MAGASDVTGKEGGALVSPPSRQVADRFVNMCTLVILRRPEHPWPLLLAGNRDEMRDRPWLPPARHWADRPGVVAGRDLLGDGSWLGLNDQAVVAVVMNRTGTLGPKAGKRSRGELVLEALSHAGAREAARALSGLEARAYRAFNLFVGDAVSAFWLRSRDDGGSVEVFDVPPGLHMLSAGEMDDPDVSRIRFYLPRFRDARVPNPDRGDWSAWQALLGSRDVSEGQGPYAAMNLSPSEAFGTVCSHLLGLPGRPPCRRPPVFLFAGGPPDRVPFRPVAF